MCLAMFVLGISTCLLVLVCSRGLDTAAHFKHTIILKARVVPVKVERNKWVTQPGAENLVFTEPTWKGSGPVPKTDSKVGSKGFEIVSLRPNDAAPL